MDFYDDPVLSRFFTPASAPRGDSVVLDRTPRDGDRCGSCGGGTDIRGRWYPVRGGLVALYPTGQLAKALHRKSGTIRLWEREGTIPPHLIERPVRGEYPHARRLYTRTYIEAVVAAAIKAGWLYDAYPRLSREELSKLARDYIRAHGDSEG